MIRFLLPPIFVVFGGILLAKQIWGWGSLIPKIH